MEIIKQGNLELTKKIKTFECTNCGCIFKADKDEYSYAGAQYNTAYYKCQCPTCSYTVYVEE